MIPRVCQYGEEQSDTDGSPVEGLVFSNMFLPHNSGSDSFTSNSSSVFDDSNKSDIEMCKSNYEDIKCKVQSELSALKRIIGIIGEDNSSCQESSASCEGPPETFKQLLSEKRRQSDCYISKIMAIDDENWAIRDKIESIQRRKQGKQAEQCMCLIF